MPAAVAINRPKTAIEKRTHTTVDTISLTAERVAKWQHPTGQRPLRENKKVREIAEKIKEDGGVVPGILTLGVLDGAYWIIDGQHRLRAFELSGVKEGYADVRYVYAGTMDDLNEEFVNLNSRLVTLRPDDILRGMEGAIAPLSEVRRACPFVGYGGVHRGGANPVVTGMSSALRFWYFSAQDIPSRSCRYSALEIAKALTEEDTTGLIGYLNHAYVAFGPDVEYARLWSELNMTLCMWLYRKLVLNQFSQRGSRIGGALFQKCLLSVSADNNYQNWLLGRLLSDRDRSPAYSRVKSIFSRRLEMELGKKVPLPTPAWT